MTTVSLLVQVDSCPYLFGDAGLVGVAAGDITNDDTAAAFTGTLAAVLKVDALAWSESVDMLTGLPSGDSLAFPLQDSRTILASGAPLLSWLSTRDPEDVVVARLTATLEADDTTFVVDDASWFATQSYPLVVWIDGEAVTIAADPGGTSVTCTRGTYGANQRRHIFDRTRNLIPEVMSDFTWTTERVARLYEVVGRTNARCVWRGVTIGSPRIRENADDQIVFDLTAQPVWNVQGEQPAGISDATLYPRGFDSYVTGVRVVSHNVGGGVLRLSDMIAPRRVYDSMQARLLASVNALATHSVWGVSQGNVMTGPQHLPDGGWQVTVTADTIDQRVTLCTGGTWITALVAAGDTGTVTSEDDPEVALGISSLTTLPLETTADAPSDLASDTATSATTPAYVANLSFGLVSARPSNEWWIAAFASASGGTVTDTCLYGGPGVDGVTFRVLRATESTVVPQWWGGASTGSPPSGSDGGVLLERVPFRLVAFVSSASWAWAAYVAATQQKAGATFATEWDTSNVATVTEATRSDFSRVQWTLTGERTLADVLGTMCAIHQCAIAPGPAGKLRIVSLAAPSAVTTVDATITSHDYITGTPSVYRGSGATLVNVVEIEAGTGPITVVGPTVTRYGRTQEAAKLDVRGLVMPIPGIPTATMWLRLVMPLLARLGNPIPTVTISVSIERAAGSRAVYIGDLVDLSDFHLPDGDGFRSFTNQKLRVVGRTVKYGDGACVTLTLARLRTAYPYAPCVRVASWSSTTLTAATAYADGADYAGDAYGTGGVSAFTAGDKVRLRVANSYTHTTEAHEVQSVDAALGKITLDGPIGAAYTAPAAGTWVELVFEDYVQADASGQHDWAFIGDDATRTIDGTTDRAQRWSA